MRKEHSFTQINMLDEIIIDNFAGGGGAVCPPMATALVKANLPEYCLVDITTMAQLTSRIAI